MSVSGPLLLTAVIFNAWQLMLGMRQITCTKFKFAFSHKFKKWTKKSLHVSGSQKPCSRRTIQKISPQRKGKKNTSNVTSEERANIWQMKPKWILLAYFRQNKAGHFSSPPLSLLLTVCWVQALTAHTALQERVITCIIGQVLHTNTCINALYCHNSMKTNRRRHSKTAPLKQLL